MGEETRFPYMEATAGTMPKRGRDFALVRLPGFRSNSAHSPMNIRLIAALSALLLPLAPLASRASEFLPSGARVAVIGDSITEQKIYSKYIECYLLACTDRDDLTLFQFGWSGERAEDFANRLANDLAIFRPTVATTCYGMNDGSYAPYSEAVGKSYQTHMTRVVEGLKTAGVTHIVVGSPGAVDPDYFTRLDGNVYNQTLARLRDIAGELAKEKGLPFANVHDTMTAALAKSKAALGRDYAPFGGDGFHPSAPGQLLMAQAFLKSLGLDGAIGTLTLDLGTGSGSASEGHKVLSVAGHTFELESSRWPFCFDADPKSSTSNRSILPFASFNEELNRFVLVAKGLDAPRAKVTWGEQTREFSREELEAGVNLAAAFSATPFDGAFRALEEAVAAKQAFETVSIKGLITSFRGLSQEAAADPELAAAFDTIRNKVAARHAQLHQAARATIRPVQHRLAIEPLR